MLVLRASLWNFPRSVDMTSVETNKYRMCSHNIKHILVWFVLKLYTVLFKHQSKLYVTTQIPPTCLQMWRPEVQLHSCCNFCEWQENDDEYAVSLHKLIEKRTETTYVLGYVLLKSNTNTGCDKMRHPHLI